MSRDFGFYEYAGVIIPGAVLGAGLLWLIPEGRLLLPLGDVSFGGLGLFVILAYAAGHLVQSVGNGLEWVWWKVRGGWPTEQALAGKLLSPEQHTRLIDALGRETHMPRGTCRLSTSERLALVREVYSVVVAAGRAGRVETFNGNYGLLRGLAASFVVLTCAALIFGQGATVVGLLGALFLLALQRMDRFSKHYALELFVQYLLVTGGGAGVSTRDP